MLTYATPEQFAIWSRADAPENAPELLRSASVLVRRATMTARYAVNGDDLPVDAKKAQAMADATCSQVGTWLALAIDPAKGAASPSNTVSAKSIGSASVQYAVYAATAQAHADAAEQLSQEAWFILADAGLATMLPVVFG